MLMPLAPRFLPAMSISLTGLACYGSVMADTYSLRLTGHSEVVSQFIYGDTHSRACCGEFTDASGPVEPSGISRPL